MKKLVVLFLLLFGLAGNSLFAQLDVLHYIPPLYGRTNVQNHYIVISTPATAPVTVTVTKGDGTFVTSAVITDVTPATIFLGTGYGAPGIINTGELNTVTNEGFIVTASAPVYVNLRHVQSAQGLSLTSKGAQTGLGTHFRSGHIYNSAVLPHVKAHEISVMATEDGTTVTFSDISPGVIFRGTPTTGGTSDDITVVLNAGESYTIAAWVDQPGAFGNVNDVNGTLITSDKPIAVNTGSWLGGAHTNLRDIGVDQLVPLELVGSEYIFIEGDGNANTERPLIVAEYDGTEIYVNGAVTPWATINSGEYFYLPQSAYSANDNIYIRTSQPVFMYQSLSGASPAATSLNFIPPLRCNGFKEVVIPSVNLVGAPTVSITARRFASVYVNGSATPLTGGLDVPGNDCWLTYEVPGGTGDFFVESDSIINVALLTLAGPRGSAGYFTGFAQFTELDRGDTTSFVVCGESGQSYVTYSIEGPYLSITTDFYDPSLGGTITVDEVVEDTVKFTYTRLPGVVGPDTLDITVCKLLECCGAIPDTICELSTLVFTNIEDIDVGLGDSIVACADTSAIDLPDLLLGTPDPGGYWVDEDGSGALFGDSFDPSIVAPGTYHFTYYVDGASICYDSTVVTINVLPMSSSTCCSIAPEVIVSEPTCFGYDNGSILVTDEYATEFSIDGGTTVQPSGSFGTISGGAYDLNLTFGPDCSFDSTIVISEPDELLGEVSVDSISCFGACDGVVSVTVTTGGTGSYVYSLGGGPDQVLPTFTDLCPGSTTLIITDENGCEYVLDTSIYQPDILLLTELSNTDETCGDSNGAFALNTIGGTPPFNYSLDGAADVGSSVFTDLSAGTYTVVVTDANGCTDDIEITIVNQPPPIASILDLNDVTCNGGLNGSVIIGVTDGTAPFTYSLDGGTPQPSNAFPAILAGTHEVIVVDANGCSDTIEFIIDEPSPLTYSTTVTDVTCFEACDGEIAISASGATPPYMYSDDNGLTFTPFDVLDDLCAGDIFVVVQDANGCLANSTITITEPTELLATFSTIDPACHGTPTGEIDIDASGGVLPYSYSTDGGASFDPTEPLIDMYAGDYDVVVQDANGCEFIETITLTDPPPFTFTYVSNDPSNCGADDGSFEMIASGGTSPYTYSLDGSTPSASGLFDGLFSGLYTLSATDADGCTDSTTAALSDNIMTGSVDVVVPVTCYNGSDGVLGVSPIGGVAPYTYTIDSDPLSPQPFGTFTGLEADTYFISIEDDGLCLYILEIEIVEPDTIEFAAALTDITCPNGSDGAISISSVTGGDGGPYEYSIDGGITYGSATDFTGLIAGDYTLYVRDGNGCEGALDVTLNQPEDFEWYVALTDINCFGDLTGAVQVVADGSNGPVFTYYVGGASNLTGIFTGLGANDYTITVEDGIGCTADSLVTLTEPPILSATYAITDASCFGLCDGEIEVTASGGVVPYLYSDDAGITLTTSPVLDGLCAGDYDIYVEDDNGCIITSLETVNEPTMLSFTASETPETCDADNGTIEFTASGGTPIYNYSVDGGDTFSGAALFTDLSPGYYDLYLEDSNGCNADTIYLVTSEPVPNISGVSISEPLCFGGTDAEISITSDAGVGVHEYSITSAFGPYQLSGDFTGLTAGAYTVYVRDENGCIDSTAIFIDEPENISYSEVISDLTCFENSSGIIELIGDGGTVPYEYSIDNGVTFQGVGTFEDLAAGDYDIIVIDDNGCSTSGSITLLEPALLAFDPFTITPATCFGFCDGEVAANVIGGTAPYSYTWSGILAGSTDMATGACAGTYSVVIEDANGCNIDSINFVVAEPDLALIDSVNATAVTCWGDSDGELEVYSANAGFYSVDAGPFTTLTNYTGLTTGLYWVYVQDANGCPGDSLLAFVPTPMELLAFISPDEYICPGDTVYPSIVATGGTTPHSFAWNDGTVSDGMLMEEIYSDTIYFVTVTDANGCVFNSDTMTVTTAPPPVLITSNDTIVCPGTALNLSSYADDLLETYLYSWETGETTPDIYPTIESDTMFVVTVIDECLLQVNDTIVVNIFDEPIVSIHPDILGGCPPFQINYTIVADVSEIGSDFFWSTGHGTIDSSNFNNLYISYSEVGEGVINLSFTSSYGCSVDTTFENLVEFYEAPIAAFTMNPNPPTIYDNEVYFNNVSINNEINTWLILEDTVFSYDATLDLLDINPDSSYNICLVVENEYGCADTACQVLMINNEMFLFVPNTILIDSDGTNAVFKPVTNYFHPDFYSLQIFNRWGELIFETNDTETGWDGTYVNGLVQDGVYIWKIKGAPMNNPADLREYYGHINVLR